MFWGEDVLQCRAYPKGPGAPNMGRVPRGLVYKALHQTWSVSRAWSFCMSKGGLVSRAWFLINHGFRTVPLHLDAHVALIST